VVTGLGAGLGQGFTTEVNQEGRVVAVSNGAAGRLGLLTVLRNALGFLPPMEALESVVLVANAELTVAGPRVGEPQTAESRRSPAVVSSELPGELRLVEAGDPGVADATPMPTPVEVLSVAPEWEVPTLPRAVERPVGGPVVVAPGPAIAPAAIAPAAPGAARQAEPTRTPAPAATSAPARPTSQPTSLPAPPPATTVVQALIPTVLPTIEPTAVPTAAPTAEPTAGPTVAPTVAATSTRPPSATVRPTSTRPPKATVKPVAQLTSAAAIDAADIDEVEPTALPTVAPTKQPTTAPTIKPTIAPTIAPTSKPTTAPTKAPTSAPTARPTNTRTPVPVKTVKPAQQPVLASDTKSPQAARAAD
jgi:hypothetical protein